LVTAGVDIINTWQPVMRGRCVMGKATQFSTVFVTVFALVFLNLFFCVDMNENNYLLNCY
jgi:hypothetical protein